MSNYFRQFNWTQQQFQDFLFWCWSQNRTPTPSLARVWMWLQD